MRGKSFWVGVTVLEEEALKQEAPRTPHAFSAGSCDQCEFVSEFSAGSCSGSCLCDQRRVPACARFESPSNGIALRARCARCTSGVYSPCAPKGHGIPCTFPFQYNSRCKRDHEYNNAEWFVCQQSVCFTYVCAGLHRAVAQCRTKLGACAVAHVALNIPATVCVHSVCKPPPPSESCRATASR